jgi:oligopeptidase B
MAAAANMKPDLFKLIMLDVPAVDDLTYFLHYDSPHFGYHFAEFGDPKVEKYFNYIFSYDPYHNIRPQNYPYFLVTGGLNDSNVPYWQPLRYIAKIRQNNTKDSLVILKMNKGGHEGIKNPDEYLKEIAFVFSFMFKVLKINH